MEELIKSILSKYLGIRLEEGAGAIDLTDLKIFLSMLDATTLGDISADLNAFKKNII